MPEVTGAQRPPAHAVEKTPPGWVGERRQGSVQGGRPESSASHVRYVTDALRESKAGGTLPSLTRHTLSAGSVDVQDTVE